MDKGYSWIENKEAKNIIYLVILISYSMCLLINGFQVKSKGIGNIYILFILLALFLTRHYCYSIKTSRAVWLPYVLAVAELCLIYVIYLAGSDITNFIFILFSLDISICFNTRFTITFSFLGYLGYFILDSILKGLTFEFMLINQFFLQVTSFFIVPIAIIIAKRQFIQSSILKTLMEELRSKTLELEELAVLKERNRIAGEMHDTVGHTLTTALVEIEASKLLFSNNPQESYVKLGLAGEQIRKGLRELRDSVKKISEGASLTDFIPSLHALKAEVEKHADIRLHMDIDDVEGLNSVQQKVLYRVIMESVTNSIKHGKATVVDINLKEADSVVALSVKDNGRGQEDVVMGFGLSSMQDRIEGLGGRMIIESKKGKGFLVAVEIPKGE